jgi:hypothetical protein
MTEGEKEAFLPGALRKMSTSVCMEETEKIMVGVEGESNEMIVEKHLYIKSSRQRIYTTQGLKKS